MRIYRIVVRGQFDGLDADTKQALRAARPEHDYLNATFTRDGMFVYDERLVAFNLRYETRVTDDDVDDDAVGEQALARAAEWLERSGYPHKRLTVTVTDMATMWEDRPSRA
ncbi:MAG: DUF6204 family protein [Acidimicrobiales bacterium]